MAQKMGMDGTRTLLVVHSEYILGPTYMRARRSLVSMRENCLILHPSSRPSQELRNISKLTSLFYAGKNETDLSRRVGRDGGECIIHGAKHLSTCTQDRGDQRQVQPQAFALRCDDTQGRKSPLHVLDIDRKGRRAGTRGAEYKTHLCQTSSASTTALGNQT